MKTPTPVSSFLDHVLVDSTDSCSMSMTDDTVTIKHTDGPCQTATTTVEGENVVRLRVCCVAKGRLEAVVCCCVSKEIRLSEVSCLLEICCGSWGVDIWVVLLSDVSVVN